MSPYNINRSVKVAWDKLYERNLLEGIRFKNVIIAEDVEFKRNRYIPFIKKCSLLSFYYMPFLYRLFRWGLEKQAKYR